ncbi:hypothetical protein J4E83_002208 [Alternaria metachromatica]|uniref:uncharacterized protein n=1 Tax=Alternaria metachromatica TaxID=283354 RepID=UPI0020C1C23B|nr:uncharacterized protein J4E83_002208 [Alternaria metachromatica]KAI4634886.1 hypothetical protein J4E83_002208 [Alternaria metachromatica]
MTSKRKASDLTNDVIASDSKRPKVARVAATKEPRRQPTNIAGNTDAKTTSAPSVLQTRPWLTRDQPISEQDLFILHCRDNLIPGATGPKDWHVLAEEFNARFDHELKKPLAYNTLSKRCGAARKLFLKNNPEYVGVCIYPVPRVETGAEEKSQGSDMVNSEGDDDESDTEEEDAHAMPSGETAEPQGESATQHLETHVATLPAHKLPTPVSSSPPTRREHSSTSKITTLPPGFFNPSTVEENYILPNTRAKFHLQQRTDERVTFRFSDPDEGSPATEDAQYVDANTLISISPFYARTAAGDPRNTVITVPDYITIRTVNIFIQLISPERANELPTHYLWSERKSVSGVYDRYGAIRVEKIIWTVDALLDLLLFAQWMEVYWIVDMVVDRLHFLFAEEARCEDIFADMGKPVDGYVNIAGRQVFVGSRLPPVDNTLARVTAKDFERDFMVLLAEMSASTPVWRFLADLLYALGEEVKSAEWFPALSKDVQRILSKPEENHLDATTARDEFCRRYHHHAASSETCYTAHRVHSATHNIDALYASSSPKALIRLSKGLDSTSSLTSIMYSSTGNASKLKHDNSTQSMLDTEKMVLDMEGRLYEAKMAMQKAREAREDEKKAATDEASKIARSMYSHEPSAKGQ